MPLRLISVVFEKLKLSTEELEKSCLKWSLKIKAQKCKIISDPNNDITMNIAEKVNKFIFWYEEAQLMDEER